MGNDKFTQNHSYRVSVYAVRIAEEMRLPESQLEDVRAAALLHDIGKLETSREILYKAARLSDDEIKEMKMHVEKGIVHAQSGRRLAETRPADHPGAP